jgi:hypothetical protein
MVRPEKEPGFNLISPLEILVGPVKVIVEAKGAKINVPVPDLDKPPVPVIVPLKVVVLFPVILNVADPKFTVPVANPPPARDAID